MKRKFGLFFVAILALMCVNPVFAKYNPDDNRMTKIPDSPLFEGTDEFTKEQFEEWVRTGMIENMVDWVLDGNYGFVINQNNYWSIDHKETWNKNTAIQSVDGTFSIEAGLASKLFNIKTTGEYITAEEIVRSVDGWEYFVDHRGFCLFSRDIENHIEKDPVSLEVYNGIDAIQYRSYYPVSLARAEIAWQDRNLTEEDIEEYILSWENTLLRTDKVLEHEDYLKWLFGDVKSFMDMYDPSNVSGFSDGNVYQGFNRIRYMAKAYRTLVETGRQDLDAEVLKEQILSLLEVLYNNTFSKFTMLRTTDNWFNTRVTYPRWFADALMLMRDEVSKENYQKYLDVGLTITIEGMISRFCVPPSSGVLPQMKPQETINPFNNYSNLIWCTNASIRWAALARDPYRLERYYKFLAPIFEENISSGNYDTATIRDGVFEDGTFKFHNYYMYNLGYGNSYAAEICETLVTTAGTKLDIRNTYGYENIYSWIEKAWIPFLYNGDLLKIVQGREDPAGNNAVAIITSLMTIADYAPTDTRERILKMLPPVIGDKMNYYHNIPGRIPTYYSFPWHAVKENIKDSLEYMDSLSPEEYIDPVYSKVFYNGDKAVHKQEDYLFMLSMSSERIGRYEAINNQSYSDWYIGSGMTQLLTDTTQLSPAWWHSIDRYRMPGTTVDSMKQKINSEYGLGMPENSWAGGASDGEISVLAMKLPGNWRWGNKKLIGNKSYFLLKDKIICLGSDIKNGEGEVFTILDNLMLTKKAEDGTIGIEDAYVNETKVSREFDKKEVFEDVRYMWAEGNRGYVFHKPSKASAERVRDSKSYTGTKTEDSKNKTPFMTLMAEHGAETTASYAYAILPDVSLEETKAYSENQDYEILRQDTVMHAIKLENGIVMANIFRPAELEGFRFITPSAVILKPNGEGYKIYMAEPTQKAGYMKLELPEDKPLTDGTSEIIKNGKAVSIKADDHYGKTYSFNYNIAEGADMLRSDDITVGNIKIRVGETRIETTLPAYSQKGRNLEFEIITEPQNGYAYTTGNKLKYIPGAGSYTDEAVIKVCDTAGEAAEFKVIFEKQ